MERKIQAQLDEEQQPDSVCSLLAVAAACQSAVSDLLPIKRQYTCQQADRRQSPTPPPHTHMRSLSQQPRKLCSLQTLTR